MSGIRFEGGLKKKRTTQETFGVFLFRLWARIAIEIGGRRLLNSDTDRQGKMARGKGGTRLPTAKNCQVVLAPYWFFSCLMHLVYRRRGRRPCLGLHIAVMTCAARGLACSTHRHRAARLRRLPRLPAPLACPVLMTGAGTVERGLQKVCSTIRPW